MHKGTGSKKAMQPEKSGALDNQTPMKADRPEPVEAPGVAAPAKMNERKPLRSLPPSVIRVSTAGAWSALPAQAYALAEHPLFSILEDAGLDC
jgi:hypothetical protein